jgi:glycoprotein endo-alpha-1,2-mannosidase
MVGPRNLLNKTESEYCSTGQLVWLVFLFLALLSHLCMAAPGMTHALPSDRVHAFYYPWYGNPQTDGKYANWNHPVAVRNGPARRFPGGDDIGANFFPALGSYSVNDPAIVKSHMQQLQRAHIGVISVSWWGRDSYTDRALPLLFQMAEKHDIQINFHIEPHLGPGRRNALQVREAIVHLIDTYGDSPALYRHAERGKRPMFYVYDSYLSPAREWATILAPEGSHTIRDTKYDAVVIGLWVKQNEEPFFLDGHFDGFYTYFATDGFTYGSTLSNWKQLSEWARAHNKLFIPCVAPGYIDTRIRPWNGQNTRDRQGGKYYDRTFQAAIDARPDLVGITSFNEWHEGTQIEPAVSKQVGDYRYLDYLPRDATWYLDRTAHWVKAFEQSVKPKSRSR